MSSRSRRSRLTWAITLLLLVQLLVGLLVNMQAQMGNWGLEPRSTLGAIETFLHLACIAGAIVMVFTLHRYAWVAFLGLAFYRAAIIAIHMTGSATSFETWIHVGFFLEFTIIGLYLYRVPREYGTPR